MRFIYVTLLLSFVVILNYFILYTVLKHQNSILYEYDLLKYDILTEFQDMSNYFKKNINLESKRSILYKKLNINNDNVQNEIIYPTDINSTNINREKYFNENEEYDYYNFNIKQSSIIRILKINSSDSIDYEIYFIILFKRDLYNFINYYKNLLDLFIDINYIVSNMNDSILYYIRISHYLSMFLILLSISTLFIDMIRLIIYNFIEVLMFFIIDISVNIVEVIIHKYEKKKNNNNNNYHYSIGSNFL